jgi:hypothetical protein
MLLPYAGASDGGKRCLRRGFLFGKVITLTICFFYKVDKFFSGTAYGSIACVCFLSGNKYVKSTIVAKLNKVAGKMEGHSAAGQI